VINTHQSILRSSRLETNAVEGQIGRGLVLALLISTKPAVDAFGFLCQDLGVLDEVVPLDWMKLLQVLKQSDSRLRFFTNNFAKGEKDLL
jgi:hypothetical protein